MRKVFNTIKIFISCAIIFLIIKRIDLFEISGLLKRVNIKTVVVPFVFLVLIQLLLALRWRILLGCKNIKIPFKSLLFLQFLGLFFNAVLPTTVGGDIFKIWRFKKKFGKGKDAFASIFAGRVIGIAALIGFFIFIIIFNFKYIQSLEFNLLPPLLSILMLCIFFVIFWKSFLRLKIIKKVLRAFNLEDKALEFQKSFSEYKVHPFSLFISFLISFTVLFLTIGYNFLIAGALSLDVTFQSFLIFIPIIFLLTLLPFTVNGWGIREGAYIFFFAQAGLTKEQALTIDIIAVFLGMLLSLPGGFIYLKENIKGIFK
jgi:uncharacterized protein (TIRG00374 family)